MAIDLLLEKTHVRRIFFAAVIAIVIVIITVRYLLLPIINPKTSVDLIGFVAQFLDALVTSLLVTVAIGVSVFWITPKIVRQAVLETVEPRELPGLFEKSFQESEFWYFRGGTGRYFRAKTVPLMARWARSQSNTRRINGIILDPSDESVCNAYANYRSGTASAKFDGEWTITRVKMELIATILVLWEYARREQLLQIELTLTSAFSSFRIDLGSSYAIVTREDRQAPAVKCDQNTFFYNAYRDEVILSERYGKKLNLEPQKMLPLETLDVEGAKNILAMLDPAIANMPNEDLEEAIKICHECRDPYGKTGKL